MINSIYYSGRIMLLCTSLLCTFLAFTFIAHAAGPTLDPIGDKSVNEGELLAFVVSASDSDGDDVDLSLDVLPPAASFNPLSGQFSWQTSQLQAGEYSITFTATEQTEEALSDSETIIITVVDVNRAPVLSVSDATPTVGQGEEITIVVSAIDPDQDNTLTLGSTALPVGSSFDPETGIFSWLTEVGDTGVYHATFTVTDDASVPLTDAIQVTFTVNEFPENLPPTIESINDKTVNAEKKVKFTAKASDPNESDVLTFSSTNLPQGATLDPQTGFFSWKPEQSDVGVKQVNITVTDNGTPELSANTIVTINVQDCLPKIHETAIFGVDPQFGVCVKVKNDTSFGDGASLGDFVFVAKNVIAGDEVTLGASTTIRKSAHIGSNITTGNGVVLASSTTLGDSSTVGDYAKIRARSSVGSGATIGAGARIGKEVSVGNNLTLGPLAALWKAVTVGDDVSVGTSTAVASSTTIGSNVSIGDSVKIKNNVLIEDGVSIGANSNVRKDAIIREGAMLENDVLIRRGGEVLAGCIVPSGTIVKKNEVFACDA